MTAPDGPAEPRSLSGVPGELLAEVGESLACWLPQGGSPDPVEAWSSHRWEIAAWLAYWQGVASWVLARAEQDSVRIDPGVRPRLEEAGGLMRARTGRLLEDAAEVLAAVTEAGIPVMPLKGTVISQRYLADPLSRGMRDVDLLIRPRDRRAVGEVLASLGYRLTEDEPRSMTWMRGAPLPETWSPDHLRPVDVHLRSVGDVYAQLGLDLDATLWEHGTVEALLGVPGVHVLRPAALLLHVAQHASNNLAMGDPSLSHLRDLEAVGRRLTASDWEEFLAMADALARRLVFPALALLGRYAPGTMPPRIVQTLEAAAPQRMRSWIDRTGYGREARTSYAGWAEVRTLTVLRGSRRLVESSREWWRLVFPPSRLVLADHRWAGTRLWPLAYLQDRLGMVRDLASGLMRRVWRGRRR